MSRNVSRRAVTRRIAAVTGAVFITAAPAGKAAFTNAVGPVTRAEWQQVLADAANHGRLTRPHSCAAIVVARTHAPPRYREGSELVHAIDVYLYRHCRRFGHEHSIKIGMTDRAVVDVAGAPVPWMSGPICWVYRERTFNALRVCFAKSRVTQLGWAAHG